MSCMKCGRESPLGHVFCKECLADMEKHPVKPGTPVIIPTQPHTPPPRRTPVRKTKKPEEQVALLKKLLLVVSILLVAVSLAFAITVSVLSEQTKEEEHSSLPGQNYSTESTT